MKLYGIWDKVVDEIRAARTLGELYGFVMMLILAFAAVIIGFGGVVVAVTLVRIGGWPLKGVAAFVLVLSVLWRASDPNKP